MVPCGTLWSTHQEGNAETQPALDLRMEPSPQGQPLPILLRSLLYRSHSCSITQTDALVPSLTPPHTSPNPLDPQNLSQGTQHLWGHQMCVKALPASTDPCPSPHTHRGCKVPWSMDPFAPGWMGRFSFTRGRLGVGGGSTSLPLPLWVLALRAPCLLQPPYTQLHPALRHAPWPEAPPLSLSTAPSSV